MRAKTRDESKLGAETSGSASAACVRDVRVSNQCGVRRGRGGGARRYFDERFLEFDISERHLG